MYNKSDILKDLKDFVIEFTFPKNDEPTKKYHIRCTLKPKYLPASYKDEKHIIDKFQKENGDIIAAFNLKMGQWIFINTKDIEYVQIIDGY